MPVGNVGNAPDPQYSVGAASYNHGMCKYEVTLDQSAAFLNAAVKTDTWFRHGKQCEGWKFRVLDEDDGIRQEFNARRSTEGE